MLRKSHEPRAAVRVIAANGLHEADVAFLDEVRIGEPVAEIAAGDGHDEAQVRKHQLLRGGEVVMITQINRERALFLSRKHGSFFRSAQEGVERSQTTGRNRQSCGLIRDETA